MKRISILIVTLVLVLGMTVPVAATGSNSPEGDSSNTSTIGNVTYSGDAGEFIFEPGSNYSPTDLFPNFKEVMPGDTLTQKITVKNNASDKVNVKIYMRALGAHKKSVEFLSQLYLSVKCNETTLFHAAADQSAQLSDWVLLGTLNSGGNVDLDVTLHVPGELDNKFRNLVGKLDWQFMVEEIPADDNKLVLPDDPTEPTESTDEQTLPSEPTDESDQPVEPEDGTDKDTDEGMQTGDEFAAYKWLIVMAATGAVMIVLIRRRKNEES